MSLPAANWYPDPHAQGSLRWWDGTQWTDHVAPAAGAATATRSFPDWAPLALGLAGAALALLGMVLPVAGIPTSELGGEIGVKDNSIVEQGGLPLLILPAAILAAWRSWENYKDPEGAVAGSIGSAIVIFLLVVWASSRVDVETFGLDVSSGTGIGIYASGIGAALIVISGVWQRALSRS